MRGEARILIVDDEPASRDALAQRLERFGYHTRQVAPAACLAALRRELPDLLLLDIRPPVADGLGLLRAIRTAWPKHELPVVILTTMDPTDALAGLEAGANDYVIQPVVVPVLCARLQISLEILEAMRSGVEAERALVDSERRFRLSFDRAPIGMALTSLDGRFLRVNPALCRMSGYTAEELLQTTWAAVSIPEDVAPTWVRAGKILAGEVEQYEIEKRILHKNGQIIWTLACTSLARDEDGRPLYFISQVQDITERRRSADELARANDELERRVHERTAELEEANALLRAHQRATRELASQASLAAEQERRRIAAGLHDDIGQILALMKLKLGVIERAGAGGGTNGDGRDCSEELAELRGMLDEAIKHTRSLTFELGARVLFEFGLEAALESLVEQFRENHEIDTTFTDDEQPKPLDEGIKVALFRAVRELLHNVAKHARGATHVRVRIGAADGRVRVEVSDDGAGFDPASLAPQPSSGGQFGLFNIRERLAFVGGSVTFDSAPGAGTRVTLEAPLRQEAPAGTEAAAI